LKCQHHFSHNANTQQHRLPRQKYVKVETSPSIWIYCDHSPITTTMPSKNLERKHTTLPTTFLSLPREIRQIIILDALHQSYTFTWHTTMIRSNSTSASLKGRSHGWSARYTKLVFEMQNALRIAELRLDLDVGWAFNKWCSESGSCTGD
jgi:hypothetical protein